MRAWHLNLAQTTLDRLAGSLVENPVLSVPQFAGDFEFDARSRVFQRLLLHGSYEAELIRVAKQFLRPDRDVVDVGANVGFYSVALAQLIQPTQRVVAVEPNTNVAQILRRNLQRNDVAKKTIVVEAALSATTGHGVLQQVEGMSEFSTIGTLVHPAARGEVRESAVLLETLDSIVDKFGLNPGFVKVDVEGAERAVLGGAIRLMNDIRPTFLCEVSDTLLKTSGSSFVEVIDFMRDHAYAALNALEPTQKARSAPHGDVLFIPRDA